MNCSDISLNIASFDSGSGLLRACVIIDESAVWRRYSRDSLYRSRGRKSDLLGGHNERGVGDMRGTRCDFVAKGAKRCSTIRHAAAGPQSPRANLRTVGHAKV